MTLIDHVGDVGLLAGFPFVEGDFVEDAENLIGVDGAEGEVVIGVAAVVEVEAAEHVEIEEPGYDLFDVLRGVVVAGIDEDLCLWTGGAGEFEGHAPIRNIGVIESGFEGLVFDQEALIGGQGLVCAAQVFYEPGFAATNILGAGIVGAIGEPEGDVAAFDFSGDVDAVENVIERGFADLRIGISEGAEFVDLILKEIGVDGAGADAGFFCEGGDFGGVVVEVPEDVERESRADTGDAIDLGGVSEFFFDGGGGGGLVELAEAGACIGETPGGEFDAEAVERVEDSVCVRSAARGLVVGHMCIVDREGKR